MNEFQSFGKIKQIGRLMMSITQKIHGTNAQIYINENNDILVGNRTRWLTLEDDNFGFFKFVHENREEFISKLGTGRHFGEWAGPGINSGEGLSEKTLLLFNWRRWKGEQLPQRVNTVPVLYSGKMSLQMIEEVIKRLKLKGSSLVPGYMKPEGIVVEVGETFYKKVFEDEETGWSSEASKIRKEKEAKLADLNIDTDSLLQPIRLEKLLSRDERYVRDYPDSLSNICKDYMKDLEEEGQLKGTEEEIKLIKKLLGRYLYPFVKEIINAK